MGSNQAVDKFIYEYSHIRAYSFFYFNLFFYLNKKVLTVLFAIHLGPAPFSRWDVGKYCAQCKKYQSGSSAWQDNISLPSWDAKRKIKASTGVCSLLHNMTNVHCYLKRKEDELRKCVMNGALSLRVSSTRSNRSSSKALLPKTLLYWAVANQ